MGLFPQIAAGRAWGRRDLRPYPVAKVPRDDLAMHRSIRAGAEAQVPFRHAERFLRRPPLGLFGPSLDDVPSPRRFHTTLAADGPGGVSVAHGVDIEIVAVRSEEDRVEIDLRWSPTGGSSLLPPFAGTLQASGGPHASTELTLKGSYRVPLGLLGRFGDGVVGFQIARRSVGDLLDRIAARLERLTLDSRTQAQVSPAPYPPDLGRGHGTECAR